MFRKLCLLLFAVLCCKGLAAQENLFGDQLSEEEIREREYFRNIIENGTLSVKGAAMYIDGYLINASEILDMDLYANWLPAYNTKMVGVYIWSSGASLALTTGLCALIDWLIPSKPTGVDPIGGLICSASLVAIGIPIDQIGASKLKKITNEQNRRRQAGKTHAPRLNFGATNNGVGFSLNF